MPASDFGGVTMDLFAHAAQQNKQAEAPLADRMRPTALEDFVGQEEIVGPGRLLRRAIEADRLSSVIFYGPPGTGKTTLARVIAGKTASHFEQLNAVSSGVADLRRVVGEARDRFSFHRQRTIVFIDEIHRFNRSQQDALLPAVEDGTIILIGATTENPFFEINSPLISRSRIFRLEPLARAHIIQLLNRAMSNEERGLARLHPAVDADALEHLADAANGDARVALNALELAVVTTPPDSGGARHVTLAVAEESIQRRMVLYDRSGDNHYDVISAFIKSMRGSDPDAAVYWLGRMIAAGEDPRFIARRLMVHAAEDVGMADPVALLVASAAAHALEWIGLPEARIPLAEAAIYIATAPKSNSVCCAIDAAIEAARSEQAQPVPTHLRDAGYPGAGQMGHGKGYLYPHNFDQAFVIQQYLPSNIQGRRFYQPKGQGREAEVADIQARRWGESGDAQATKPE